MFVFGLNAATLDFFLDEKTLIAKTIPTDTLMISRKNVRDEIVPDTYSRSVLTVSYGVRTMNDSNDYLYCCFLFRILNWHAYMKQVLHFLSPTFTLRHIKRARSLSWLFNILFLHVPRGCMYRNVVMLYAQCKQTLSLVCYVSLSILLRCTSFYSSKCSTDMLCVGRRRKIISQNSRVEYDWCDKAHRNTFIIFRACDAWHVILRSIEICGDSIWIISGSTAFV